MNRQVPLDWTTSGLGCKIEFVTFNHTIRITLHMLAQYQQAIEKYRQRVFSFAYYSLRGREDAEDITQDVFIRLWQHWNKVDPERMGAWLMRVAHNIVIDHVRKHKADKQRVNMDQGVEDLVSVSDNTLERAQFQHQLESAISGLADPYRSIIIMRDVQGMSYFEIEQTLNLSQSQVKVYLHRGRRQLRENKTLRQMATEHAVLEDDNLTTLKPDQKQTTPVKHESKDEGINHV